MPSNRRSAERKDSLNFIDYVILGDAGGRGLARTLNISEKGLLLETTRPLRAGVDLLLTLGLKEELIRFGGRVVHTSGAGGGRYRTGIVFVEIDRDELRVLRRHLKVSSPGPAA